MSTGRIEIKRAEPREPKIEEVTYFDIDGDWLNFRYSYGNIWATTGKKDEPIKDVGGCLVTAFHVRELFPALTEMVDQ